VRPELTTYPPNHFTPFDPPGCAAGRWGEKLAAPTFTAQEEVKIPPSPLIAKKRHPPRGVMPRGRCPASMPLLVILTTLCRRGCTDSPSSSFAMAPGKHCQPGRNHVTICMKRVMLFTRGDRTPPRHRCKEGNQS
jgi:hypothetical protein